MNPEQRRLMYRGYEIVSRCESGACKGKAWTKEVGLNNQSDDGVSLDDVVDKICRLIDIELQPRTEELRGTVPERHRDYLIKLGKPDRGLKAVSITRPHRASVCYQCGEPVDNKVDFECAACEWIVCNACAACGCGHDAPFGPKT